MYVKLANTIVIDLHLATVVQEHINAHVTMGILAMEKHVQVWKNTVLCMMRYYLDIIETYLPSLVRFSVVWKVCLPFLRTYRLFKSSIKILI